MERKQDSSDVPLPGLHPAASRTISTALQEMIFHATHLAFIEAEVPCLEVPGGSAPAREQENGSCTEVEKWLVRGLLKFTTAVARLVCPDLLG